MYLGYDGKCSSVHKSSFVLSPFQDKFSLVGGNCNTMVQSLLIYVRRKEKLKHWNFSPILSGELMFQGCLSGEITS